MNQELFEQTDRKATRQEQIDFWAKLREWLEVGCADDRKQNYPKGA